MKKILTFFSFVFFVYCSFIFIPHPLFAKTVVITSTLTNVTNYPSVTKKTTHKTAVAKFDDIYEQQTIQILLAKRPAATPTFFNFFEYIVQYAVKIGVPSNTIVLILLLPLLATLVAFVRHVIGLPNLGLLVTVAFSITFLTIGIVAGMILLAAIILASTVSRIILKRIRIMQLPKMALSMFVVAIFVFIALVVSGTYGLITVKDLSIFPVLLLILLGERIVALQLERNLREATSITVITLILSIMGFFLLAYIPLRETVLLYPEIIFLLIPINIAVGRYFGLRLVEYFRFRQIINHGSK